MALFQASLAPSNLTDNVRNRLNGKDTNGEVRLAESVYTTTGTEAATGDSIEIAVLPVGAKVLPHLCRVSHEADLGGSVVAIPTMGDAVTANRYSATSVSLHSSTAGSAAVTPAVAQMISAFAVTEATSRIRVAVTRTNAVTAGKKIAFSVAYRI